MVMLRWCYANVMVMLAYPPIFTTGLELSHHYHDVSYYHTNILARVTPYLTDKNAPVFFFLGSVACYLTAD